MKRLFALILMSVIVVSVFSSCSSGEKVSLLDFIGEPEETIFNLKGKTITISSESDIDYRLFEQLPNTIMYDAILERLHESEKKYNCVIEHVCNPGNTDDIKSLIGLIATGDSRIDIIYGHGNNQIGKLALSNALYPLTELKEYLDYENSEKFGSAGLLEAAMMDGVPYAVQPVQWVGFPNSFAFHLVWNVDRFQLMGLPDLHEYYENEIWTWDTFETLCDTYSSIATEDLDLIGFNKSYFALTALYANGVKFCDYDGEKFYCDFDDSKTYRAAEWTLNLFEEYKDIIKFISGSWDVDPFMEEQVLIEPVQAGNAALYLPYKVEFEFSLMPFPAGPDATYGEWANFFEAIRGFGISYHSDEPEASACILNDLFEPIEDISGSGTLLDYYASQVFRTETDAEIFLEVGNHARNFYSENDDTIWNLMNAFTSSGQTAAQIIQRYSLQVKNLVDEQIQPNFEKYVYEHLYGNK